MWNLKTNGKFALVAAFSILFSMPAFAQEAELLRVLRSGATLQEKSDACRELARVATADAVPTLAAMLGDERMSHMARYALESIPDDTVDQALREALTKVQGRPRLGVIGSLGARRDAKAVTALAALLGDEEAGNAAARALGSIATAEAAAALRGALGDVTGAQQLAICEGLLRCAESFAATGDAAAAREIYEPLRKDSELLNPVRAAALRGAILSSSKDGAELLADAIIGSDDAMAAAAVRAAMESRDEETTAKMVALLSDVSASRRALLILALADRGDRRVLSAALEAAQSDDQQLRVAAFRALKQVGDATCVPALLDAATVGSEDTSQAAIETLACLQDDAVDQQVARLLTQVEGKRRLVLLDLAGRRRTPNAADALWRAASDADPSVRVTALKSLGAVTTTVELPKLIARLGDSGSDQEAAALDQAIRDVCLRSEDRELVAAQLAKALAGAGQAVQGRILDTLNIVGGETALQAVADAARSGNAELQDEASRVLGQWKSVDAAPVLLELHNTLRDNRLKIRAIRAYIRIARQFDMPAQQRASMCRTALQTAERDTDKQLVLEILLRYPSGAMQAIALEAAKDPALKEQALLVAMGMKSEDVDRGQLGRALAEAGQKPVKLEITRAEYGAGSKSKDVTEILREHAKNVRIIFLPASSYNRSFGGDPAPGTPKKLTIHYRVNGKAASVSLSENATVVLPLPE